MCSDKPDVNNAIRVVDPDHNTIFVTRNVEDGSAVLKDAGAANVALYICRSRPVGLPDLSEPSHDGFARIRKAAATTQKGLDRAERYHPHRPNLT